MKIDEAIKRNTDIQIKFLPLTNHRDWEAIQLGIEALKVLKHGRLIGAHHDPALLPGETKD